MIHFKDFNTETSLQEDESPAKNVATCVGEASRWIGAEDLQVLNVETVVLPNQRGPEGKWHQVVRVWYRPR